jgi:hypothetical protein
MTWIRCDETPAPLGRRVLVLDRAEGVCIGEYNGRWFDGDNYDEESGRSPRLRYVSHWQPLPEPPTDLEA